MTPPRPDDPEERIIEKAIFGEAAAFGELYDRYFDAIYRFILFQVSRPSDAEDLTETVFLKAFENLPGFRSGKRMTNFRAWVYRIARNLVIDHYRTKKQELSLEAGFSFESDEERPEDAVQFNEESERIKDAVRLLREPYRQVIVMRFISGLTYTETADALGLTENYTRVIQFRALRKLKELLQE